jgi:hypothetical protein
MTDCNKSETHEVVLNVVNAFSTLIQCVLKQMIVQKTENPNNKITVSITIKTDRSEKDPVSYLKAKRLQDIKL